MGRWQQVSAHTAMGYRMHSLLWFPEIRGSGLNIGRNPPQITANAIAIDSHDNPSTVKIRVSKSKTDPFGKGTLEGHIRIYVQL